MSLHQPLIIAIDGPGASGKSTVSQIVAKKLGLPYLDTGALYRAVGVLAHRRGIAADDAAGLAELFSTFDIRFLDEGRGVSVNGEDLSSAIRTAEAGMLASTYSAVDQVREFLLGKQRELALARGGVVEGRDIGTVVFPNADVKFFLVADAVVRAARRAREWGDKSPSREDVRRDLERRDNQDSSRALAPLRKAGDALEIDTSNHTIDEVVLMVLEHIHRTVGEKATSDKEM